MVFLFDEYIIELANNKSETNELKEEAKNWIWSDPNATVVSEAKNDGTMKVLADGVLQNNETIPIEKVAENKIKLPDWLSIPDPAPTAPAPAPAPAPAQAPAAPVNPPALPAPAVLPCKKIIEMIYETNEEDEEDEENKKEENKQEDPNISSIPCEKIINMIYDNENK